MEKFTVMTGVAASLPLVNVDTDMIIPKQFLKTNKRTGLGSALFHEMRYRGNGEEIPEFVLISRAKSAEFVVRHSDCRTSFRRSPRGSCARLG